MEKKRVRCPFCYQRESVGFLKGSICKRYFCKYCCIEFSIKNGVLEIFELDGNGIAYLVTDDDESSVTK